MRRWRVISHHPIIASSHHHFLTFRMRTIFLLLVVTSLASADEPARPPMTDEPAAPGKFVRQVAPEYAGTSVYHALYLPVDWQRGKTYPVIVEYAPNRAEAFGTTGRVEDCRLGYYWTGGRGFLWVVMPYVNTAERKNQDTWWGDEQATVDYCLKNLPRVCDEFGGDPDSVLLTGFSRGAIACGYLGLRNEEIADVWLGFWPHSHIDSGRFTPQGGRERLARTRGRATLVTWGETDGAKTESPRGAALLTELGQPVTSFEIAGAGHTDKWIERDSPERQKARTWLDDTLRKRPGTFSLRGRVVDPAGSPMAGCLVECGTWHRATSDAQGRFQIRGLTAGTRSVRITREGRPLKHEPIEVTIEAGDVEVKGITISDP